MQANILRAQGWRLGQGYHFGRPAILPVTDLCAGGDHRLRQRRSGSEP